MACLGLRKGLNFQGEHERVVPDSFVGSELVSGLNDCSFQSYLKDKEIAMVMFYHKSDPQCSWSKKHFKKAAEVTCREGHSYAAIDCEKNSDFCIEEGVAEFPHFKIYARGEDVGFSSDARKLLYQDMKTWVEGFPICTPK